jgi:glycosyltransferase involved in cell wall biosynthesis
MPQSPESPGAVSKRALVICYSGVGRDARVSNEIRWLEAAGYQVDILSRGPEHPDASGRGFRIGETNVWLRLVTYALLPPRMRFRKGVEEWIPTEELLRERYDLVYVNDHHLLPWVVKTAPQLTDGPVILDLHELYSGNGTSLSYKLLFARYDDWLLSFLADPVFTTRLTVAEGIADIYRDEFDIPRPDVFRNVAPYEQLEPSPVDPERIVLVHHGYASVERGIDVMLDAALLLEPRFVLELMIIGDERTMAPMRDHPAIAQGRAVFREPVGVTEVARTLNAFDLELIFFPPRFPNNKHALPNKFFEAIQGRLGVIIGESPEIVPLVREHGFGIVVEGWTAEDLARAVNALTVEQITAMKQAANAAAEDLSSRGEGVRFREAIGI